MFIALFILLFVTQPVKGPSADSMPRKGQRSPSEINSEQDKDTSQNHFSSRLKSAIEPDRVVSYCKRVSESEQNKPNYDLVTACLLFLTMAGTWALAGISIRAIKRQSSASHAQLIQSRNATRNQLAVMRESTHKQLRAYVSPEPVQYFAFENYSIAMITLEGGEPTRCFVQRIPTVWFTPINSGQTPAYNVTFWVRAGARTGDIEEPFDETPPDTGVRHYPVLHRQDAAKADGMNYEGGRIENIPMGDMNLGIYYWGRIDYKDAFGKECFTKFRFIVDEVPTPGQRQGRLLFTEDGNETEETR